MDWLANITLPYILAIVAVLLVVRLLLGKSESPAAKSTAEGVESALIAVVLVFLIIRPFVIQAFYIPSGSMLPTLELRDHILVNKFIYRFREPKHGDIVVFKSPPWIPGEQMFNQAEWNKVAGTVTAPVGDKGEVRLALNTNRPKELEQVVEVCITKNGNYDRRHVDAWSENGKVVKLSGVEDADAAKDLVGAEIRVVEKDFIKRLIGEPGDVLEVVAGKGLIRNGKLVKESYTMQEPPLYDMPPTKVPEGMFLMLGDNRNNSNDGHIWGFLSRDRVVGKALVRFWPLNRMGLPR